MSDAAKRDQPTRHHLDGPHRQTKRLGHARRPLAHGAAAIALSAALVGCGSADQQGTVEPSPTSHTAPSTSPSPSDSSRPTQILQFTAVDQSKPWGQLEIPGDWSAYQRSGGSTSVSAPSNENLTSPFGGVADIWLNKAGSLKAGSWKAMDHYKGNGFQTGELANVQTDGGEMYHFLLTRDDEPDISREVYGIVIDDQIYEIKWTILNNEIDLVDAQMQIADVMKTFVAQPK